MESAYAKRGKRREESSCISAIADWICKAGSDLVRSSIAVHTSGISSLCSNCQERMAINERNRESEKKGRAYIVERAEGHKFHHDAQLRCFGRCGHEQHDVGMP